MDARRFEQITARYAELSVVLVGDIALDRYLHIDPNLAETSIETGRAVRNVVSVRPQPGGGGNVLANLGALGPARLAAVGFCGDDGEGYELRRCLEQVGADLSHFLVAPDRMTFTYTKPLLIRPGRVPEELDRMDIRSRTPTPADLEARLIEHLHTAADQADVIVAMDQVPEADCGVCTRGVRRAVAALGRKYPGKVFLADSRTRIGEFEEVRVKVNADELRTRFAPAEDADPSALAARWAERRGRDVFVTLGAGGILAATGGASHERRWRGVPGQAEEDAQRVTHVPGIPVEPPVDIVGAGDTVLAHIAMALGAGASPPEAAVLGNLAGSIVVRKIGTTGTADLAELRSALGTRQ